MLSLSSCLSIAGWQLVFLVCVFQLDDSHANDLPLAEEREPIG